MYLKNIALFLSIYGRGSLAVLPDSCQDDGPDVCGSKKCVLPLGAEDEPAGTGEVWYSQCCTVAETSSTADPPFTITESKKYCYNYVLNGYPSNELNGIKPICSEIASGNSAWTLDGQCRVSGGVSSKSIFLVPFNLILLYASSHARASNSTSSPSIDAIIVHNSISMPIVIPISSSL